MNGGLLVWNYGEDRLQILFDRIPEDAKRKELNPPVSDGPQKTRHGSAS